MNMTNQAFGERIGRTASYVSYLRNGKRKPSFGLFVKILDAFDLETTPAMRALEGGSESFGRYLNEHVFPFREIRTREDGSTYVVKIEPANSAG
jgi:transcriptional regulator with XRE-family HTH domain